MLIYTNACFQVDAEPEAVESPPVEEVTEQAPVEDVTEPEAVEEPKVYEHIYTF